MEIGLWNSIGYISQAIGLRTTAASTVRRFCLFRVQLMTCTQSVLTILRYPECIHLLNGSGDCTHA